MLWHLATNGVQNSGQYARVGCHGLSPTSQVSQRDLTFSDPTTRVCINLLAFTRLQPTPFTRQLKQYVSMLPRSNEPTSPHSPWTAGDLLATMGVGLTVLASQTSASSHSPGWCAGTTLFHPLSILLWQTLEISGRPLHLQSCALTSLTSKQACQVSCSCSGVATDDDCPSTSTCKPACRSSCTMMSKMSGNPGPAKSGHDLNNPCTIPSA